MADLRVFLSYARADGPVARAFADLLRSPDLVVWLDVEFLRPGESWEPAIVEHIMTADAFVYLASAEGVRSHATAGELAAFVELSDRPVVPVLIGDVGLSDAGAALPPRLTRVQAVTVADPDDGEQLARAARTVAGIVREFGPVRRTSPAAERPARRMARTNADRLRRPRAAPPDHVFLVHGRDLAFRDEVDQELDRLGLKSIILAKADSEERSLFARFESLAAQAAFAVVLLTPDDYGTAVSQYHARRGRVHALRYRARQNVVLELGFFYGRLGWEHVLVIQKDPPEEWPEFELPSDLAGILFVRAVGDRDWRTDLRTKLVRSGVLT